MCRSWPGSQAALGVHGRKGIRFILPTWYHEPDADEDKLEQEEKRKKILWLAVELWVGLKEQQRAPVSNIPTLWVL